MIASQEEIINLAQKYIQESLPYDVMNIVRAVQNLNQEIKAVRKIIHKAEVKRGEHFIDVRFTLKTGEVRRVSYNTLAQRWANADDFLGLLNYVGINVQKPNLNDLGRTDQILAMKQTFDAMKEGLVSLLKEFGQYMHDVFNRGNDGESYALLYEKDHSGREDLAQSQLDEMLGKNKES